VKVKPEEQFTLASLRKRLNLTVTEVAEFMGMSRARLISIEKDSTNLGVETLYRFMKLYSMDASHIFLGKDSTLSEELRKKGGYK
jgi:transcriptional regulator with XRE-family HTH domain